MDAIGGLYFLFHVNRVRSEGPLLRLHVLTSALMLSFSAIVSAKQAVGNPIDCVHTRDIPTEAFNAYCWIHSTYFVTGAMLGVAGVNVAFPGVGQSVAFIQMPRNDHGEQHGRHRGDANASPLLKQVKYYQWVAFCLVFQRNRSRSLARSPRSSNDRAGSDTRLVVLQRTGGRSRGYVPCAIGPALAPRESQGQSFGAAPRTLVEQR